MDAAKTHFKVKLFGHGFAEGWESSIDPDWTFRLTLESLDVFVDICKVSQLALLSNSFSGIYNIKKYNVYENLGILA